LRLRGQRQGGDAQLLPGLQSQKVCAFFVLVGVDEVASTGFQRRDRALREVTASLDDRQAVGDA
jgi:hypothetical protein